MKKLTNKIASALLLSLGALSLSSAVHATQALPTTTPKDPGVINEERIVYWLKKRGEIKVDASALEIEQVLYQYKQRATIKVSVGKYDKPIAMSSLASSKGVKSKGVPKTVKALAILIDFPDLPFDNNRLNANDTGMYYSSYPVDHYRQLMFSTTGYDGPSNQNLMSGYQFYQQESGNEFFFTGDVFGWVTADNNSDTYGANDPDNDDNDIDATTLIQEAVSKAVADNNIDLAEYDLEDPFDLDGDGVIAEADGFIDHVNIFHSSIGEEAGGGVLGDDAIWSHRFFVNATGNSSTMGFAIPGTTKKLFGYTIQPIDAATGVVVHEFGHDLGLADEYDTGSSVDGAPTGNWSVMASGSWTGTPSGSMPVGFSALAREYLQDTHGANWVNQTVIDFADLSGTSQSIDLVEAVEHQTGVNQIKINLPNGLIDFGAPYTGSYQYYFESGDNLRTEMSFDLAVPAGTTATLQMKARWAIEQDWDYVQVSINDVAISGNHTVAGSPLAGQYADYADVTHFISGNSADIANAEVPLGWVDLSYDLSSYLGQTVSVKFYYYTDTNTGDYGFAFDDMDLIVDNNSVFSDGAEVADAVTLNGFKRITDKREGKAQNYWVQLRSLNEVDAGLNSRNYEPGVVIWFADENYGDNKVGDHPGHGFIGVVDADQELIGTRTSSVQIRDAAFSLFAQNAYSQDNSLAANPVFDDSNDYSSPNKPAAGLILPTLGLRIEVLAQSANSSTATVQLAGGQIALAAEFSASSNLRTVNFTDQTLGGTLNYTYQWDFGDGSGTSIASSPSYQYTADGSYDVELTVTDTNQDTSISNLTVVIETAPNASFTSNAASEVVSFTNTSTGGIGNITYAWVFGDGGTSSEVSPSYTYAADGTYATTLTITDSEGRNSTVVGSENIIDTAPVSDFSFSSSLLVVAFTDASSGGRNGLTYAWDFGDGATSTEQSPSHTYAAENSYSVTLTITDGNGRTSEVGKTVSVVAERESNDSGGGGPIGWLTLVLVSLALIRRKF